MNQNTENCLSDRLNLEITKEGSVVYGPVSLTEFFAAGEKKIDDLNGNDTQRYYFKITFLSDSENQYQGKEVSFDFDIGFFGQETIGGDEETGGGSSGGGGGGGGGTFGGVVGLVITEEKSSPVVSSQTEITWKTNKPATSRVIYSSEYEPHILDLTNPPNYGYARSTEEDSTQKTEHSMNIFGLEPGVTYYYRVVSRGSFAISLEHSFTVPGVKPAETFSDDYSEIVASVGQEGSGAETGEGELLEEEVEEDFFEQDSEEKEDLTEMLLASFGNLGNMNFCAVFLIFLIIVIALMLMSLESNKKQKDIVKRWILTFLAIIALIILYSFICSYYLTLLIAVSVLIVAFLLWYFRGDKKSQN